MAVGIPATPRALRHAACIDSQRFGFVVDIAVLGGLYALVRSAAIDTAATDDREAEA